MQSAIPDCLLLGAGGGEIAAADITTTTATASARGTIEIGASVDQTQPKIVRSSFGVHQPRSGPSMTANTSAPNAMALSRAPSTSTPGRFFSPRVSGTVSSAATKTMVKPHEVV